MYGFAGTKTVAAKAKPKKTWLTPIAGITGLSERELRRYCYIGLGLLLGIVAFAAFLVWLGYLG
jgi:hypothetical protein